MYCKKCGKFIGTDVDVCEECKQKEILMNKITQIQYANPYLNVNDNQPPRDLQDTSDIKLGRAIAALVLTTVGLGSSFLSAILGIFPSFIGLILGIMSISNFRRTSHIKSGKRIPLLIFGISSVVNFFTNFIWLLVCLILFSGSMLLALGEMGFYL